MRSSSSNTSCTCVHDTAALNLCECKQVYTSKWPYQPETLIASHAHEPGEHVLLI